MTVQKLRYNNNIYLADVGLLADRCLAVEGLVALDEGRSIDSVLSGMAETCGQRKMHLDFGKISFLK